MKSELFVILILILCHTNSYKILVCYPLNVRSLNILGGAVVKHLLDDGHEVTFITTHPLDWPHNPKLRQIHISTNDVIFKEETYKIGYVIENNIKENDAKHVQKFARDNARLTFNNENVTTLLKNTNEQFDAIITDLLESEVYAGLAVLYDCPMIWLYSMGAHWQVLRLIADSTSPAYDTDYLGNNIPPFTFAQRVKELWKRLIWIYYKTFITTPIERDIYEQVFRPLLKTKGRQLPNYADVIFNSSLIFGNEYNTAPLRPSTPQNFKYIGGFHIDDPVKPLSGELQYIMDNSIHGVIYFSMGSFWKSKELPLNITKALINVFSEIKQTVIWKFEDELNNLPNNLHVVRWAPQQSILAHPKCKFFITHGGLLSMTESIHFGVPIIGIPVLYDQFINMNKASDYGHGIIINLNYNLPQNLKAAINTMLSDDRYSKKAKYLSSVYHDRPIKPSAELVHWVRHVIRTRGATHLRSPAIDVPFYQRYYFDLVTLIIIICLTMSYVLKLITKKNCKNNHDSDGKNKKKKQ